MKMMKTLTACFLALAALFIPTASPVSAEEAVSVSINCQTTVSSGANLIVTIEITNVSDLNAAQFDITFNPALFSIENISHGQIGDTTFPANANIVTDGHYRVLGYKGTGTVSGEGYLAVINFYARSAGSSGISLSNGILSGINGEIQAAWQNTTVTVIGDSATDSSTVTQPSATTSTTSPSTTTSPQTQTTDDSTSEEPEQVTASTSDTTSTDAPTATTDTTSNNDAVSSSQNEEISPDNGASETDKTTTQGKNETLETDASKEISPNKQNNIKWPILWSIIGGVLCIIGLTIYAQVKKRNFYY